MRFGAYRGGLRLAFVGPAENVERSRAARDLALVDVHTTKVNVNPARAPRKQAKEFENIFFSNLTQ